ncbi:MAG: hypothetical protein HY862_20635 [Chloroflexi bacterium]|nr:hypothetical protein [Chloroflexota bacterium]
MLNVRSSSNWITRLPLILVVALMLTALLVACGDKDEPAPTEIVVVTGQPSATASPTSAPPVNETETIAAILESSNATATAQQQIIDAQATQLTLATTQQAEGGQQGSEPTLDPAIAATQTYQASLPSPTPTATATDLPSIFPTPQIEQAIVVEQVFEGGRMFWFRENHKIWIVYGTDPTNPDQIVIDPAQGEWVCFDDTFVDGEQESDPAMEPAADAVTTSTFPSVYPQARVQQPIRGFGKLWREQPELRDHLGWALTAEIEYNTRREYLAGGTVQNGAYVPAPGEWRVGSFFNATYIFLEKEVGAACPTGTWRARQG